MSDLLIVLVVVGVVASIAWQVWRRRATASTGESPSSQAGWWSRPSSFSFLVFEGDLREVVPQLLEKCDYTLLENHRVVGEFGDVYEESKRPEGEHNEIVSKIAYPIWNRTVLLDPEMVMSVGHPGEIADFCAENNTSAVAAVWERVSGTIILDVYGATGVVSSTFLVAGRLQEKCVAPHRQLTSSPSVGTLIAILQDTGITMSQLFGKIDGTKYRLTTQASES